jgi:hypothetical protein
LAIVTLQHDHPFEVIGDCPRGGEPGNAGTDHHSLFSDMPRRHCDPHAPLQARPMSSGTQNPPLTHARSVAHVTVHPFM